MNKAYCVKQIWSGFGDHQCSRKIKVTRDGKGYCKQHDPVEVERRQKAQSAKWKAEAEERDAKWGRAKAEREACEGISTEVLRSGVLKRLWESHRESIMIDLSIERELWSIAVQLAQGWCVIGEFCYTMGDIRVGRDGCPHVRARMVLAKNEGVGDPQPVYFNDERKP